MNQNTARVQRRPEGATLAARPAARRRHPARRARRIVGAAGVIGMAAMTGYMTLNSAQTGAATSVQISSASVATSHGIGTSVSGLKSSAATAAAATPTTVAQTKSKSS